MNKLKLFSFILTSIVVGLLVAMTVMAVFSGPSANPPLNDALPPVRLQTSTPGTQQTGNFSISGTALFGGNVGIGTTGPGHKLDVQNGQINSSGGLCIAGDCKTAWSQVGGATWTSPWFSCTTGGTYTLTHNLGSNILDISVLVSANADGSNAMAANNNWYYQSGSAGTMLEYGWYAHTITNTQLTMQFAERGLISQLDANGNAITTGITNGYCKVIATKID